MKGRNKKERESNRLKQDEVRLAKDKREVERAVPGRKRKMKEKKKKKEYKSEYNVLKKN